MSLLKKTNNISGLQLFQITRFTSFLIISIVFTKSHLTLSEIGIFELLLFFASAASYFWVTGLIHSLLPLYKNNNTFLFKEENKSPELFNAFLLLSFFSILIFIIGISVKNNLSVFGYTGEIPFYYPLLLYILLSNPAALVEYIYLLRNKPDKIVLYGFLTFSLQLFLVITPVLLGYGITFSVWSLVFVSALRIIWLIVLLKKYAEIKLSFPFIFEHLSLATPLIISSLLSGSAQYIDGIIVSNKYDAASFAVFRYGAKELPFVVMLAAGLHSAMLPEFSPVEKIKQSLKKIKKKSARLMHILFPLSMIVLLFSKWLFNNLFNEHFTRGADVFMVYLLLVCSRLLFPQTILIGLKKTKVVMFASIINIIVNVSLSLMFLKTYGLVGVALATVVAFVLEKFILIAYNYFRLNINPKEYIPVRLYVAYSVAFLTLFVLIDHRIIFIQ